MRILKQISTLLALIALAIASCQNNSKSNRTEDANASTVENRAEKETTDIPFIVAKNYFVKNTFKSLDNAKIETSEKFNEVFGMAATMGEGGKPTEIDFQKQYVIALILPETDTMSTVVPISLKKDKEGKITLTYKKETGPKQSFSTRPTFQIIVDKTESGSLELKKQN